MASKSMRFLSSADAELPSPDSSFAFDGTNSDLARQLYYRAKDDGSISPFGDVKVPSVVQDRLKKLKVKWDRLSGIAQRALLWDSGFGITDYNRPVKIWTLSNYSMADLAVPLDTFRSVGCEEKSCPQSDNTVSYSNEWCGGTQMLQAARCVVEDFVDNSDIHAAMWVMGGNPQVIPTPYVRKHEWDDQRDNRSYIVFAVHTLRLVDEPAWDGCPLPTQNKGYGSLVLPCFTTANISNATMEKMVEVEGSAWVSRWLKEDYATEKTSGFDTILLVPIIGGIIVAIGIFAVLTVFKRRKQFTNRNLSEGPQSSSENQTKSRNSGDSGNGTLNQTYLANQEWSNLTLKTTIGSELLAEKRVPFDSIVFERMLSKGASGEVWAADLLGQPVAVKRLLQNKVHLVDEVEEFAREIQLSATLVHPNIVGFVGVAWNSLSNLVMVLEFVPLGDLQGYLRKSFDLLLWRADKMHMAVGIALALEYLHTKSPPIIHRDLKSKNILISKNLDPKLSDFGVSRRRQDNSMTAGVGTPYWAAPEILEGKRYTEQADIYSFGVVLSELDTGKNPYHDALTPEGKSEKPFKILAEVIAGNLRPTFSAACPDKIRRIGEACCQHDPASRPSSNQVVKMLQD